MRSPLFARCRNYAAMERREAEFREARRRETLERDLFPVEPCESEEGAELFERLVSDDDAYNALSMSIRGERLWDSAEGEVDP